MTSVERTAYPRFKRLITAHELHLLFAPTRAEAAWAAERMDSDGHQLALLLALKSYQRMGRFPKADEYPEMVVDFVRRTVELPQGTLPLYETGRTAERQRAEVRQRMGTKYKQSQARQIAEAAIRKEVASKNRLFTHLEWLDKLGATVVWVDGVASPKVTDFAGEADAADASELRDYAAIKRIALLACLARKARMRVRDDLATGADEDDTD